MYIIFFIHKTWKYLLQFSFLYARFIKWNSFVANSSCVFFHLLMFSTFVCQEIEAVWKYSTVMQPEKFPRLGCFANCVSLECAVVCFRTLSHRLYRFPAFTVFYFVEQQHLVCLSANFIAILRRYILDPLIFLSILSGISRLRLMTEVPIRFFSSENYA